MSYLRGDDLRQAFLAGTHCLERYRDAINALNVFPVPDGDTGTNMLLTMRSAMARCPETADPSAAEVSSGLAEGAFWGARGNSGVILSQLFRGFAEALREAKVCDAHDLAKALRIAADAAYESVAQPVEGTMLTVLQSVSSSVQQINDKGDTGVRPLWDEAFRSAVEALHRTPSQLSVLKEAGVVDAGAMGVAVIIGGALCYITDGEEDLVDQALASFCAKSASVGDTKINIGTDYLDSTIESHWGYCIQFLVQGEELALESIQQHLGKEWSDSAVVVGDHQLLRVHVHGADPGPILSYGASLGELHQIKIENMNKQNKEFVTGHRNKEKEEISLAVVGVVQGSGLVQLFKDAGCYFVINGGQSMNPSVGQFLDAAQATGAEDIIVLPNNPQVEAAAIQSAGANPRIHVVSSLTLPQGVSAMLAFNPVESLQYNLKTMRDALSGVVTLGVIRAAHSYTVAGVSIDAGHYISLLEGEVNCTADTPEKALKTTLKGSLNSASQIVTIYQGEEVSLEAVSQLCRQLEKETPGLQVDLVYGGQPHYHYLASVE